MVVHSGCRCGCLSGQTPTKKEGAISEGGERGNNGFIMTRQPVTTTQCYSLLGLIHYYIMTQTAGLSLYAAALGEEAPGGGRLDHWVVDGAVLLHLVNHLLIEPDKGESDCRQ